MNRRYILILIIIKSTISFGKNNMPGILMIKNKLKNNTITKITKKNINKFIKRVDEQTTKNILNFVTTPSEIFIETLDNKLSKLNLSTDQLLITKINECNNNFKEKSSDVIVYINEIIYKIDPTTKIPIATFGQKLEKESKKLDKYISKINYFLDKKNKLKKNISLDAKKYKEIVNKVESFSNKINKLKQNIAIIVDFINNIFNTKNKETN